MQEDQPPKRGVPQPLRGGPIRFGPYMLEARIAVGGTAEVYLASVADDKDKEATRLIVKRLLPHFLNDPDGRTMFQREADLHAAVNHPNVVHVFGSGVNTTGEPYLAMEYVDGVDAYRLLRRFRQEGRPVPVRLAVHIVREVLAGLQSVHSAADSTGTPLGIIHRDLTPSNLYLSREGAVKVGDFGIARATARATMRNAASAMLKGKISYLAPEQVAGEPFDQRADLFSVASVLAEMAIGQPLFPGAGQLAILLAIRDCRIDALREHKGRLPKGLFEVLERALSREPKNRYQSAADLAAALALYDPEPEATRRELALHVVRAQTTTSSGSLPVVRESLRMRAVQALSSSDLEDASEDAAPNTAQFAALPSFVTTRDGTKRGPWVFARLAEALATGEVGRNDMVEYQGQDACAVDKVEELARLLPPQTATTSQLAGPGAPDLFENLETSTMTDTLLKVLENRETGVLFAQRADAESDRKELYFLQGKLHHVASSNALEMFGHYLVRREKIDPTELEMALNVLPRYGGRMGDTLIALGFMNAIEIFKAIRDQGRDKVADLFKWRSGTLSFYREEKAPQVEFPLDLDVPSLVLLGLEASHGAAAITSYMERKLNISVGPGEGDRAGLTKEVNWPPLVAFLIDASKTPVPLRMLVERATKEAGARPNEAYCAIELLVAAHLLMWGA
ncbi:MAG: serine/threonine-protein kinase [Polyangiaceae bacterium]